MNRRPLLLLTLALAFAAGAAACAGDITAVNGKRAESAPDVALVRTTYGVDALYYVADLGQVPVAPDGHFSESNPPGFPPGTTRDGNIDRQTGRFHSTVHWPPSPDYYYREVDDAGRLTFGPDRSILAASYTEDRLAGSPQADHFTLSFQRTATSLDLTGTLEQGGVEISSVVSYGTALEVTETHSVPTVYVEHVDSTYPPLAGQPVLVQTWSRDELATSVSPDTSGGFTLEQDGTGSGEVNWYFDHGITEDWRLALSQTAEDVSIVRTNPATIGTDGLGHLHFAYDGSGTGYYDTFDPDGSTLSRTYTWYVSGALAESWSFDDAATAWPVDSSGDTTYNYDGSGGSGNWTRFDAPAHAAETCTYTFDSGDAIVDESCN